MPNPFIGELKLVSFAFPPKGWALCHGQLLAIQQNQALFSLLGTTFGGNGQTTFALPDLRGRGPLHVGTGFGLTTRSLGELGGANAVTLTTPNLPIHNHFANVSTTNANSTDPAGHVLAATADPSYGNVGIAVPYAQLGPTGANQPHSNMQPYIVLSWIICLVGIFPSRN